MAIHPFLAMTAAEISGSSCLPPKIGWMACHFSPYSTGLSNSPMGLPQNSLLILNDITPIHGHDNKTIAAQLEECVLKHKCSAVLLDFQRPDCEETAILAAFLANALPCPTVISALYGKDLDCPVLLPPVPHHVPLADYLLPWAGREIWLELALDSERILVTEEGSRITMLSTWDAVEAEHEENGLHCHYHIALSDDAVSFTLRRTKEDLLDLLTEAESLGISNAVGLFQELREWK